MPVATDNIDDPVELMLKKTGCIELHYNVQVRSLSSQASRKRKRVFPFIPLKNAGVHCHHRRLAPVP